MNKKVLKEIISWVLVFVIAFALAKFINKFVFFRVNIPSESMENTILVGDKVFISKVSLLVFRSQEGILWSSHIRIMKKKSI